MKKNLSVTDRIIRFILAVNLLAFYFVRALEGVLGVVLLVLALVLLVTSLIGICPLYLPFRWNTNRKKPIKSAIAEAGRKEMIK